MSVRARYVLPFVLAVSTVTSASAAFLPSQPFTDNARGTAGAAFLENPVGARAEALAGTYAAVQGDPDALYWNPAGLVGISSPELSAAYNPLLESAYSSAISFATPFKAGVLGLGVYYDSQSPLQGYDQFANPTGSITQYDLALAGGWARSFGKVRAGFDVKLFQQNLAGANATGAAVDVGLQEKDAGYFGNGLVDLGVMLRNVGTPVKLGSVSDPLPLALTVGALWHATPTFSWFLDGHFPDDEKPYPSIAAEWRLPNADVTGALRAGYSVGQADQSLGGLSGLTIGAGLNILKMRLDYAWIPVGTLGTTQRITLGFGF